MLRIIIYPCSFCNERNIRGILDLSIAGMQRGLGDGSVLSSLAHFDFFNENKRLKTEIRNYQEPGIRIVVGAKQILICYV